MVLSIESKVETLYHLRFHFGSQRVKRFTPDSDESRN